MNLRDSKHKVTANDVDINFGMLELPIELPLELEFEVSFELVFEVLFELVFELVFEVLFAIVTATLHYSHRTGIESTRGVLGQ